MATSHDNTCKQDCPAVPPPSPKMVTWIRFEARATWVLSLLGLLRPWYALVRFVLRTCPRLVQLVPALRQCVLCPSRTGGGPPLPVSRGNEVGRPMTFGGVIHNYARCSPPRVAGSLYAPAKVVQRYRRRHVAGVIIDEAVGWVARRGGR